MPLRRRCRDGAVVDPSCSNGSSLKVGDRISLGTEPGADRATRSKSEPDSIADRLTFGPRVFVSERRSRSGSGQAGQPGALALRAEARRRRRTKEDLVSFRVSVKRGFPRPASRSPTGAIPRRRFRARWSVCGSS